MTTGAVCAGAARTALALAIVLSCWSIHDHSVDVAACKSTKDFQHICVSDIRSLWLAYIKSLKISLFFLFVL